MRSLPTSQQGRADRPSVHRSRQRGCCISQRTAVCRASRRAAARTILPPTPSSDLTAELLEGVIKMALQNRLKKHQSIATNVECDAWGLLEGRFRQIAISGAHWRTPLELTAHRLEVEMGEMQVDYGALVWRQALALRNAPQGHVRISLSAADLGNFMAHPIFQRIAATAVHGSAFEFDKTSVTIQHSPSGEVRFEGVWAATGRRYRVAMRPAVAPAVASGSSGDSSRASSPGPGASGATASPGARARGVQQQQQQHKLLVGAQHLARDGEEVDEQGALRVASGLAHFFTHLHLDLEGIELRSPSLLLHRRDAARGDQGDLLDIAMRMRMRAFPPLHMQF